ncbi:energy-coupling factor ABC transporter permease [Paraglaciecola sp. L1A13]|uniref:energy-coupling factor ABC transporter permease n=1 Tax=Paraglaciecola sp. L1A13 TaxID=2686359 RepID=UPI00131EC9E8|nr:energy-coupling factor ABC transporter permease [Paraglaciecola sp. L1A13]
MLDYTTNIQYLAWVGYVACLALVVRNLSVGTLVKDKKIQHLVFGCAASVFFLWIFQTGIFPGLQVHFLWLTALMLILGFRWAMISACLALVGVTLVGEESWRMLGVNGLLGVLAPLGLSYLIYSFAFHKLSRHVFVYIFVCAFLPGALMMAVKMYLLGGYFYLDGQYDWLTIEDNYLVLIWLLLFPEGMLNGMTMTLMVIYKPEWVYTFYEKYYIDQK